MLSPNELYKQFEFTENNHIKYWYDNDQEKIFREDEWQSTSSTVGACQRTRLTFRGELIRNTKIISRKHKEPMSVFFSGGLDSEIALNAWIESKAPFRPVIVRFKNNLNIADVEQATDFCNMANLTPTFIDFDPVSFYESGEWQRVAKDYQSYTFYQQVLCKIAEDFAQPMITIDEVELEKVPDMDHYLKTGELKLEWVFLKKEDQDGVWRRFVAKTGIPAYNNFYTYNPETMLAFLEGYVVNKLITDQMPGKLGWTSSKNEIYSTLTRYPFKKRIKRTGVECMFHIWTDVEHHSANLLFATEPRIYEFSAKELIDNMKQGKVSTCSTI
jgi:hypothetical protein